MNNQTRLFLQENFGTLSNLTLTLCVVVYGAATWLRDRTIKGYRKTSYKWWWSSWVAWLPAWVLLFSKALYKASLSSDLQVGFDSQPHLLLSIPTLFMDNLNSVCMIVVYFSLTRGDSFERSEAKVTAFRLAGSISLACCVVYLLSKWFDLAFAYGVHRTWSLALGIIAPMLVGWGIYLRYNTLHVLLVGFAYGFMQPIVYATELSAADLTAAAGHYRLVVAMVLAGLKVLWAIAFIQILANGPVDGRRLVRSRPQMKFHFYRHFKAHGLLAHSFILIIAYSALLVLMFYLLEQELTHFAFAFVLVATFMTVIDILWSFWERATRK